MATPKPKFDYANSTLIVIRKVHEVNKKEGSDEPLLGDLVFSPVLPPLLHNRVNAEAYAASIHRINDASKECDNELFYYFRVIFLAGFALLILGAHVGLVFVYVYNQNYPFAVIFGTVVFTSVVPFLPVAVVASGLPKKDILQQTAEEESARFGTSVKFMPDYMDRLRLYIANSLADPTKEHTTTATEEIKGELSV